MNLQKCKKPIIKMSQDELITFLQDNDLIVFGMTCAECGGHMVLKKYNKVKDKMARVRTFPSCSSYRKFILIRKGGFVKGI